MIRHDIDIGFVKSPGVLNTVGDKIQIKFPINTSDKGVCLIFGAHNGELFMSCISFTRDVVIQQVNLIGYLGIASLTKQNDGSVVIRCNTNKFGTCTVISTIEIEYVIFTN